MGTELPQNIIIPTSFSLTINDDGMCVFRESDFVEIDAIKYIDFVKQMEGVK